ncbi:MAG TPA: hypothetical protein VLB01_08320 [Thermodesulfobacteriota bacterium]|nr:hypothetical protein [Thermodesulfobacteriota bacterium]
MIQGEARAMPSVFLPKGEEVLCEDVFPAGVIIEGDREVLLEMMEEIGHTVSKKGYNKFTTLIDFDED